MKIRHTIPWSVHIEGNDQRQNTKRTKYKYGRPWICMPKAKWSAQNRDVGEECAPVCSVFSVFGVCISKSKMFFIAYSSVSFRFGTQWLIAFPSMRPILSQLVQHFEESIGRASNNNKLYMRFAAIKHNQSLWPKLMCFLCSLVYWYYSFHFFSSIIYLYLTTERASEQLIYVISVIAFN